MGVVGAQHPHLIGESPLVHGDGAAWIPRRPVGTGEVVAGSEGVGVVSAQHPHPDGKVAVQVRKGACGLALVVEERAGAAEDVGGGGVGAGVVGEGVDVGEQGAPGGPDVGGVPVLGQGGAKGGCGALPGVVDEVGGAVGVVDGVGGAGEGLDEAVDGQGATARV